MLAIVLQGPRRKTRLLDHVGKTEGHAGGELYMFVAMLNKTIRKVAIKQAKSSFIFRTRFEARRFQGSLTSRRGSSIAVLREACWATMTIFRLKRRAWASATARSRANARASHLR